MKKILKFLTEDSVTSFGEHVYRPRWLSALSDMLCFATLGAIKPKRRKTRDALVIFLSDFLPRPQGVLLEGVFNYELVGEKINEERAKYSDKL